MKKWNLIVDIARCHNCNNCTLATKDEYVGNDFPGYSAPQPAQGHRWIEIKRQVRGEGAMVDIAYKPTMCNHCDDAPCVKAGQGAVKKRADGIVIIDPQAARGRKDIVASCPYGAISWNEQAQLPQAWIFDAHLLDQGWTAPRCQQACPTGALRAVKLSDAEMADMAAREDLRTDRPELGTRPRAYYRNLQRYDRSFVGGTVTARSGDIEDCVEGASVRVLSKSGQAIANATTDAFGDFKIDGLPTTNADYLIEIGHPVHGAARLESQAGAESRYLGTIRLSRGA